MKFETDVAEKSKAICIDGFLFREDKHFIGNAEKEAQSSKALNDEDESDNTSYQTSNVHK